jgi:hypothetical protein
MPKIKEYSVKRMHIDSSQYGETSKYFEEHVNQLIQEGWQPFGSLGYVKDGAYHTYVQPMVKYE